MGKSITLLLVIILAVVLAIWGLVVSRAQASLPSSGFQVGEPFPDIILPTLEDGSPGSIAQFRGQKILLHIFASW